MKRITSLDFPKHAGTVVTVESNSKLFESLPGHDIILVGGYPPGKLTSKAAQCIVCKSNILCDLQDYKKLKNKKIIEICPLCFDEMEIFYSKKEVFE
jgi:hypothetical protein